jgi:hypothetical protein
MKGKKYGGRTKGTPNVITRDLRHFIREMVSKHLASDLNALEPRKRAELLIRCLPYVLPTATDEIELENIEPLTLVLTREVCNNCAPLN